QKNFAITATALKQELVAQLAELSRVRPAELLADRFARYRAIGRYSGINEVAIDEPSSDDA
ncbi:hypothetical protein KJ567_06715, partial [Candidatus Bipolaricaulota bacterium]|nr:hypothetical protein [Candidatus Bipolaricaulota bacterium]